MMHPCKYGNNQTTGSQNIAQRRKLLKIGSFSATVTLKIRSSSPKHIEFFVLSRWCIQTNLVRIRPLVHKISRRQSSVTPTATPTLTRTYPHQQQFAPLPFGSRDIIHKHSIVLENYFSIFSHINAEESNWPFCEKVKGQIGIII